MRSLISLLFVLFAVTVNAEKDFSSWTKYSQGFLVSETTAWSAGSNAAAGFKIKLAPHWHTYWLNPGDSGTPVRLSFKTSPGVRVEKVLFPIPERIQTGPLTSFAYNNEVLFPIELKIADSFKPGDKVFVDIDAEWLVCEDACIPAFQSFHLEVPIQDLSEVQPGPDFALFQKSRSQTPVESGSGDKFEFSTGGAKLQLALAGDFVDFFPFKSSGVTNEKPAETRVEAAKNLILEFKKSNVAQSDPSRTGVLVYKSGGQLRATQIGESGWAFSAADQDSQAGGQALWWMLISAFIGGLILNLMPCVFPILSIKLLSLLNLADDNPHEVRMQNLVYVAGVLVSFLAIAFMLAGLRSAGQLVGWGFQLQSAVFIAALIWLFLAMALNLFGLFEIELFDLNAGHRLTMHGGYWGSFFTGVLAVVVSSPCTAPFMGVALGFGLSQPVHILFAVFFMLGLGLGFPYLLFAIFPSWAHHLPRPGPWMKWLKQVMAVPLLATAVWLFWILSQMRGSQALYAVGFGCVLVIVLASIARLRKTAVLILALAALGGLGLYVDGQKPPPPQLQARGPWQPYSAAYVESLKGQNVFIDMTADWCLTCKVNERLVLDDAEVQEAFKKHGVVLVMGDWTNRNPEITEFLNRFQRVGVPFYILYSPKHPDGLVLPEVLTKSKFLETLNGEFSK